MSAKLAKAWGWIKALVTGGKAELAQVGRTVRSKTVLSAAAGFGTHYCVKKNWIPDGFFPQAVEGISYLLCGFFRITANTDIKTGGQMTGEPPKGNL